MERIDGVADVIFGHNFARVEVVVQGAEVNRGRVALQLEVVCNVGTTSFVEV
jgi:hypothetical protein